MSQWGLLALLAVIAGLAHHAVEFIWRVTGWNESTYEKRKKQLKAEIVEDLKKVVSNTVSDGFSAIRQYQAEVQKGHDKKLSWVEGVMSQNRQDIDSHVSRLHDLEVKMTERLATKVELGEMKDDLIDRMDLILDRLKAAPRRRK